MAAPITKLRIGLKPDTPEEHTRLLINVNAEEAQTSLQIATDLRVRANPATAKIYYYNFDGSELLYTEMIEPGGSGSWDGEPGRASTGLYEYVFNGWNTETDQTEAAEGARADVYTTRKVYAAYVERATTGFVVFGGISTLKMGSGTKTWNGTIYYSTDAVTWAEWDGAEIASGAEQKIYLRGTGNSIITGTGSGKSLSIVGSSNGVTCDGNVEFLLDYEQALAGAHPQMGESCFANLFNGCTDLISAPELPATTLAHSCYYSMFSGCTALVSAPELPATRLDGLCYSSMFQGCTALASAPELPATTLANMCYGSMFQGCTALASAPELPVTTLAPQSCYASMFQGCTALASAPELPATTLAQRCYSRMFSGCTALAAVPELPAAMLEANCYAEMFYNCRSVKLAAAASSVYTIEFRIPTSGTGTDATNALQDMFKNTGGTFTGTPTINTIYYLAPPAST